MSFSKKKILFSIFLVLGIVLPIYRAHAQLSSLATFIATYLIAAVFNVVLAISHVILGVSGWLLQWVLSENFIDWNYTGGLGANGNPIVNAGWDLTRDLVNMVFVIYLAFVGLATALGIKEYEAKKILVKLVFAAILINFTPVICGAIVDASNIVMNFFLEKFMGIEATLDRFNAQKINLDTYRGTTWWNPVNNVELAFRLIGLTAFNLWTALILGLFAFIFAARRVAIWILVILSPFAFFSYALPGSQGKFWKQWWNMFLQWCFIGVTSAFFLYLGNHILAVTPDMIKAPAPETNMVAGIVIEFFHFSLPYGIALGFLSMGFLQALKGGAVGADLAIKAAKWTGGTVGGKVKTATVDKVASSEKFRSVVQKAARAPEFSRQAQDKIWGNVKSMGPLGKAMGTLGGWATRAVSLLPEEAVGGAARAVLKYSTQQRQDVDSTKDEFKKIYGKDFEGLAAHVVTLSGWKGRLAGIKALEESGGAKALGHLPEEFIEGTLRNVGARMPGYVKGIAQKKPKLLIRNKALTDLGEMLKEDLIEDKDVAEIQKLSNITNRSEAERMAIWKKVTAGIKESEVDDLADSVGEDEEFREVVARFSRPIIAKKFADMGGAVGDAMVQTVQHLGSEANIGSLMRTNNQLVRQIVNNPVWNATFGDLEGAPTKSMYKVQSEFERRPELGLRDHYNASIGVHNLAQDIAELRKEQQANPNPVRQRRINALAADHNRRAQEVKNKRASFTPEAERAWKKIESLLAAHAKEMKKKP